MRESVVVLTVAPLAVLEQFPPDRRQVICCPHCSEPISVAVDAEMMPVAAHKAELQRVSEEYALQRAALVEALAPCTCPIGWGAVKADDCPRCNPKPQHTVSGARRP